MVIKPLVLCGELDKTTARTRYEGFVKAMNEANLPIHENWIMEGFFEPEDGYECMNKILVQDNLPTAVFCCNDVMALGAISAITEKVCAYLMISRLLAMIIFTHHVSMHRHSPRFTNRNLV